MKSVRLAVLLFTFVPLRAGLPPTFIERNGLVAIEAEHATDHVGPWAEVEGRNAMDANQGLSPDYRLVVASADVFGAVPQGEVPLPPGTWVQWGVPGPAAHVAVRMGHDERKAVVFSYEKGARLTNGQIAPARRAFVPLPAASAPVLGAWLPASVRWAAGVSGGVAAVVLTNQPELLRSETLVVERLRSAHIEVRTVPASAWPVADVAPDAVVVIPATVRMEKVTGKFAALERPLVLVGKRELGPELGLTVPPVERPPGGNAMMIRSGKWSDHLRYAIHFSHPGQYRLWLLGQSGGSMGSDEAKIFFDEVPDSASASFFEMKFAPRPDWISRATARRPENRKTAVPAVIAVANPGWHNLYIAKGAEPEHHGAPPPEYRFPNWRVDKIVLLRDETVTVMGDGPAETRNEGAIEPPAVLLARHEFRPRQVWRLRDGFVVIEAEDIDHADDWVTATEPMGFTGRGYLEWRGYAWERSIEGTYGNFDATNVRQGAPEEWLVVRLQVEEAGTYSVDLRNHHRLPDGDNDVWFGRPGVRGTPEKPIGRMGDSLRDGPGCSWLDWGVAKLQLSAGLNEFYLGGRSVGFGIDRIAVYRTDDPAAKARALDPATKPAVPLAE